MGCCQSSLFKAPISDDSKKNQQQNHQQLPQHARNNNASRPTNGTETSGGLGGGGDGAVLSFTEFSLADLRAATNNFSPEFIVSESGEKAPNVVYKGRLQNHDNNNNRSWIAVKKFTKFAWPDPKQFAVR